jgi:hypothetical protein
LWSHLRNSSSAIERHLALRSRAFSKAMGVGFKCRVLGDGPKLQSQAYLCADNDVGGGELLAQ